MIQADTLALPFPSGSVDLIITNPPYPGNGVWIDDYPERLAQAKDEMRRVARTVLVMQRAGEPIRSEQRASEHWVWLMNDSTEEIIGPGRSVSPVVAVRGWYTLDWDDVAKLIEHWSMPGDVVLDPFGGTGIVALVANDLGRIGITSDISWRQAQLAQWRLRDTLKNEEASSS